MLTFVLFVQGIVNLDQIPKGFNLTIYMKSAYASELKEIGPHPTWTQEFDSSYLRSIFVKTNVSSAFVLHEMLLIDIAHSLLL